MMKYKFERGTFPSLGLLKERTMIKKCLLCFLFFFIIGLVISSKCCAVDIGGKIAHWSFDTCNGDDSSFNGYDGVVHGNPQCVDGVKGKALKFRRDAIDYIMINKDIKLGIDYEEFTIVAWFKVEEQGENIKDPRKNPMGVHSIITRPFYADSYEENFFWDDAWELYVNTSYEYTDISVTDFIEEYNVNFTFNAEFGGDTGIQTIDNKMHFVALRWRLTEEEGVWEGSLTLDNVTITEDLYYWTPFVELDFPNEDVPLCISCYDEGELAEEGLEDYPIYITLDELQIYDEYLSKVNIVLLYQEGIGNTTTTTTIIVPTTTTTIETIETTTTTTTNIDEDILCPVTEIYGTDSEEAKLLRAFRDTVLNNNTTGKELVKLYYAYAPSMVKIINDKEVRKEVKETISSVLKIIN